MPKIKITEIDNTSPGSLAESYDVVYIPGFVDTDPVTNENLYSNGEYVGLEYRKPTLFSSVTQFESLCGKNPATFSEDQKYLSLNTETAQGFENDAVPYHGIMFTRGSCDPSYILAKEILSAGLPVLYERVNKDKVVDSSPMSDEGEYSSLEKSDKNVQYVQTLLTKIGGGKAPEICYKPKEGTKLIETQTYLKADTSKDPITYEKKTGSELKENASLSVGVNALNADYGLKLDTDGETILFTEDTPWCIPNCYSLTEIEGKTEEDTTVTKVYADPSDKKTLQVKTATKVYLLIQVPDNWKSEFYQNYYQVTERVITYDELNSDSDSPIVQEKDKDTLEHLKESGIEAFLKKETISINEMYSALSDVYDSGARDGLIDMGNYSIKYITSGGYPTYEYDNNSVVTKMLSIASNRGDCIALIDHTDNPYRESNIDLEGSLFNAVTKDVTFQSNGDFGAMFTPWATYNRTTSDGNDLSSNTMRFPASFAYLSSLADSIKTNASFLAVAGSARGQVRNLAMNGMTTVIPNGAADEMQPRTDGVAVNAITEIKPYGQCIWGNRTLKHNEENLVATSFLNIRNLASDIKKVTYRTARRLTFEQNSDILWVNFKAGITPTLDRMVNGYGLSGYKFQRDYENEHANEKATLCAKIIIYPVYPVEDFYITVVLEDEDVTIE